jgi:hypothetical protein
MLKLLSWFCCVIFLASKALSAHRLDAEFPLRRHNAKTARPVAAQTGKEICVRGTLDAAYDSEMNLMCSAKAPKYRDRPHGICH